MLEEEEEEEEAEEDGGRKRAGSQPESQPALPGDTPERHDVFRGECELT